MMLPLARGAKLGRAEELLLACITLIVRPNLGGSESPSPFPRELHQTSCLGGSDLPSQRDCAENRDCRDIGSRLTHTLRIGADFFCKCFA